MFTIKSKEKMERTISRVDRYEAALKSMSETVKVLAYESLAEEASTEVMVWSTYGRILKGLTTGGIDGPKMLQAMREGGGAVVREILRTASVAIEQSEKDLERLIENAKAKADEERAEKEDKPRQEMLLPEKELPLYRRRLGRGDSIFVTRTLNEQGKYRHGERVSSRLGDLVVAALMTYEKAEDHPFLDDLPDQERKVLYVGPFDVLELKLA